MNRFLNLIKHTLGDIKEYMPWDLEQQIADGKDMLLVDVREADEYEAMHIAGSINIPRGILESACEWNFDETVPELVQARDREVVLVCRSGQRSYLSAYSLQVLGFNHVFSLATGIRGWKDYDQPLIDKDGADVDLDDADVFFTTVLRDDQKKPEGWED